MAEFKSDYLLRDSYVAAHGPGPKILANVQRWSESVGGPQPPSAAQVRATPIPLQREGSAVAGTVNSYLAAAETYLGFSPADTRPEERQRIASMAQKLDKYRAGLEAARQQALVRTTRANAESLEKAIQEAGTARSFGTLFGALGFGTLGVLIGAGTVAVVVLTVVAVIIKKA